MSKENPTAQEIAAYHIMRSQSIQHIGMATYCNHMQQGIPDTFRVESIPLKFERILEYVGFINPLLTNSSCANDSK